MVLVVLENQRGKIHPFSLEAVAAGQKFAYTAAGNKFELNQQGDCGDLTEAQCKHGCNAKWKSDYLCEWFC